MKALVDYMAEFERNAWLIDIPVPVDRQGAPGGGNRKGRLMYDSDVEQHFGGRSMTAFPRDRYEIASEIANPDAILVRSAKMRHGWRRR